MKKANSFLAFLTVPLLCCCAQSVGVSQHDTGVFEYKEIYLSDAMGAQGKKLGLNSVDDDWGIWGHNLKRVLPKDPSALVYAMDEGQQRTKDQFCFSSAKLYEYIMRYIEDTYGEKKTQRFAILPNDNGLVCQCRLCKDAGNTPKDASPAVFSMIERLAKRFPNHIFFTSYYSTTKGLPSHRMPENVGVLVSAIDYHLCPVETEHDVAFEKLLKQWSENVNHVYVWDYINNFDDYFTPFPIFRIMQRRLQMYVKNNVKGVFLNGSGTDYSTMQFMHTMVLTELLKDPNLDIEELVRKHCGKRYPNAGKLVADFVLAQEEWTEKRGKPLPIYGGVAQAIKTYLPAEDFVAFHKSFSEIVPETSGSERRIMDRLCSVMSLTRLELMRISGNIDGYEELYAHLSALAAKNTEVYSESCWTVDAYLKDYAEMAEHAAATKRKNLLLGKKLVPLTKLDEEYNDIRILTDGLLGLPSNYHCGQMISSATPALQIAIPNVPGMKKLCVWMTRNAPCHIILPERVILTSGGVQIGNAVPVTLTSNSDRAMVEFDIPSSARGNLVLRVVRNQEDRTMALDEIEGF